MKFLAVLKMLQLPAWYLYNHHLTAITVLFIHALHTPSEVTRVKTELQASLTLFERSKLEKIPSIVRASGKGDNIILAMLQVGQNAIYGVDVC